MALRWHLRSDSHGSPEQNLALLRCNMHKRTVRPRSTVARRFWDDGIGDLELNGSNATRFGRSDHGRRYTFVDADAGAHRRSAVNRIDEGRGSKSRGGFLRLRGA